MKKEYEKNTQPDQPAGQPANYHLPVLLQETMDALSIKPGGIYVDCTFGGGGHSKEILKHLNEHGKLFAFDQDADAVANLPNDQRVVFVPHNFRHLQRFLRLHKITAVDGILADLGVSSHQFDEGGRGFSIRFDADLDMRMDKRQSLTAFDVISNYTEQQLHKLFEKFGEVTNAKTLAKTIVHTRNATSLKRISNFKNAMSGIVKGNPNKYFAQVFQALRIEVNDELGALKEMLEQAPALLKKDGRIAIITFHSLEDRIVKFFFKKGTFEEPEQTNPFVQTAPEPVLQAVTKKPIIPGDKELKENPRSRSAKLRVAEKL
ncbi:MAG: 16S rRNA (cytosine(1402)-N(4))-methyltransferase RsmH [Bacteroidetes bacterium]|nr:16S rRNA (cytosine(1402)-N(4))-methyltransferase RsmH [Bacteroidota bacterium]MBS1973845.1 16S rRNA (cytosine(1402)-N(4))-methyltransferase RsmH [Bacteroidota bacterium]